jgi:hypothetical protein
VEQFVVEGWVEGGGEGGGQKEQPLLYPQFEILPPLLASFAFFQTKYSKPRAKLKKKKNQRYSATFSVNLEGTKVKVIKVAN